MISHILNWFLPSRKHSCDEHCHASHEDVERAVNRTLIAQERSGQAADKVVSAASDHQRRIGETVSRIHAVDAARHESTSLRKVSEMRSTVEAALRTMDDRTTRENPS